MESGRITAKMLQRFSSNKNEPSAGWTAVNRQPCRRRIRIIFGLLLATILYGLAELFSFAGYWVLEHKVFTFKKVHSMRHSVKAERGRSIASKVLSGREVLHPYLGFILDRPGKNETYTVNDFGFRDDAAPFHKRGPDKVIIGLFGGSVAGQISRYGRVRLEEELKKSPMFANKEVIFVSTCTAGFKQPQQLMALNYLLLLGAEFDIVVNVDGFNEVALHEPENAKKGVATFYPRNWYLRTQALPDHKSLRMMREAEHQTSQRKSWARFFGRAPLRYSITANFLWRMIDRHLERGLANSLASLQAYEPVKKSPSLLGPPQTFGSQSELYETLAEHWMRGSLLMSQLCQAHGARYFHFLQPNQYFPGSKTLTSEERKEAYSDTSGYRPGVEIGYPILMRKGEELARQGVAFHDLNMIFSQIAHQIYIDTCCHVNEEGAEILGAEIARALLEPPSSGPSNP